MNFDQTVARKIIVDGDINALVDVAQDIGQDLVRQLTSNQIRNIFGEVRRIDLAWKGISGVGDEKSKDRHAFRQIVLLKPKLAYQAGRERGRGRGVEELKNVLEPCIDEIRNANDSDRKLYFDRFVDFFEAILAYHKAAGGN